MYTQGFIQEAGCWGVETYVDESANARIRSIRPINGTSDQQSLSFLSLLGRRFESQQCLISQLLHRMLSYDSLVTATAIMHISGRNLIFPWKLITNKVQKNHAPIILSEAFEGRAILFSQKIYKGLRKPQNLSFLNFNRIFNKTFVIKNKNSNFRQF